MSHDMLYECECDCKCGCGFKCECDWNYSNSVTLDYKLIIKLLNKVDN